MDVNSRRKELLVAWKHPTTRQRYLIGRLWRDQGLYHFKYVETTPRSVVEAQRVGFVLLDTFPHIGPEWRSETLFPVFRRRLPRQWYFAALARQGVDVTDPLELLRITGGRVPTDTLEFLEPVELHGGEDIPREYTVRFPVAGWRYYNGETVIAELTPATPLRLQLEPENVYDPSAIRIMSPSGVLLGYVPAVYAWYLDSAVENEKYEARVDSIGPSGDLERRVIVFFRGWAWPVSGVRFLPDGIEKYVATLAAHQITQAPPSA